MSQLEINPKQKNGQNENTDEPLTKEDLEALSIRTLQEIYLNEFEVKPGSDQTRESLIKAILDPEEEVVRLLALSRDEDEKDRQSNYK